MMIGAGEALLSHGGMVAFMEVSMAVITDITTLGDGTVSDTDMVGTTGAGEAMAGTTGVGEAMAGTTGAGEATDGAVTTILTSIPHIDTTHITIPEAGSATITIIEITLTALAGEESTIPIPTLEALL